MKPGQRKVVLGILLALTLAATFWTHQAEELQAQLIEVAEIQRPVSNASATPIYNTASPSPLNLDLHRLEIRRKMVEDETTIEIHTTLFQPHSWYVAPPPAPAVKAMEPVAPPAPVAPTLPFTYMGQLEDNGVSLIYLGYGDRALSLRIGDTIDEKYRLEKHEAGQLVFTYLPMGVIQTLKTGS